MAAAAALMFNFGGTIAAADVSMTGTDPLSVQSERRAGADTGRIGGEKQSANGSKSNKTKNPTKGTGSASKKNGSKTGTNSASKKTKVANKTNGATKGTGSASKKNGSVTGTNSASKDGTKTTVVNGTNGTNGTTGNSVLGVQTAPVGANGATANNAAGSTVNPVLGVQTAPAGAGGQSTAPSQAGAGGANAGVLGIQSLPSTSTAYLFELNGAAALAVAGLGGYVLRRYRKR